MTPRDLGNLAFRVGVGGALASHGVQKLFGWFGGGGPEATGKFMSGMGFPEGRTSAILAGLGEAGGGALIALGLGTGPAAAAVSGTMTVAGSVHASKGFFNTAGGFELPAVYAWAATAVAIAGPGRYSLDAVTGNVLNKPWMTGLAYAATLGSAAYLIWNARRKTAEQDSTEAEAS